MIILEHSLKQKREIENVQNGGNVLSGEEESLLEQNCEMQQFFERKLKEGIAAEELIPHNSSNMAKILQSLINSFIIQFSLSSHFSYQEGLESIEILLNGLKNPSASAVL